jgi:hypothetical protein
MGQIKARIGSTLDTTMETLGSTAGACPADPLEEPVKL